MSAVDAFHEYERAIASMRADVVRALVDEGGLSLTDVAKHLKISRQAASRLYEPGL
jgi:predicted transcriptional regulator